jgi:hypothetical protein
MCPDNLCVFWFPLSDLGGLKDFLFKAKMDQHPPFEDCRLTTMTLVFVLEGCVFLDPAFSLLPITQVDFAPPGRRRKKFELPHCSEPGAILSVRYSGETRGIVRSSSGRYFKNSITIDLSTATKNVSIKLSQSKIQMCGASSEEQGREGAQYLIDHLLRIQDELDYIQGNQDKAKETLGWLREVCRGKETSRPIYKTETRFVFNEETGDEEEEKREVFSHQEPDNLIDIPKDLTSAPDQRIARFLLRQVTEFSHYSFFIAELDWLLTLEKITTRPLAIKKIHKAMVNYNYGLGFTVDRYTLHTLMQDRHGFASNYDNCLEHCVKIKLPYQPDDDEGAVRRKNKIPCHCFLIYRSGVVTQTGPGGDKMRNAYNLFWKSILEIKDKIIVEEHTPPREKKVLIRRNSSR